MEVALAIAGWRPSSGRAIRPARMRRETTVSGLGDKVKGKVNEAKGTAKESYGRETGNEEIAAEGTMDRAKGKGQGVVGEVKEAAHDIKEKVNH